MVRTMMRRNNEHVYPHWEEEEEERRRSRQSAHSRRHDYHDYHDHHRHHHGDDELPRGRYYRPTLHRERTPSPPREYIYGTRRQREWYGFPAADRHPEEEEHFRYEQSYPEHEDHGYNDAHYDDSPHYDDDRRRRNGPAPSPPPHHRGGGRDRAMEERILQLEEEEEAYQRYRREAEERYRRYEEEQLRRYEEEERNRREHEERLAANDTAEEADIQEQNKQMTMNCPYGIPKPPPPHPGFEASHNPSNWSIQMQENDEKSIKIDSTSRSVGSRNSIQLIGGSSHHSSSSKSISKIYYSSPNHSDLPKKVPPPAMMMGKNTPSDSYLYERKELPAALRRNSRSKSRSNHQRKEVLPPAGLKRDSSSSRCQSGIMAAYKCDPTKQEDGFALRKDSISSRGSLPQKKAAAASPKASMQVEIQPGFSLPLKGSQETLEAVAIGRVLHTPCLAGCGWIVVRDDCDFVICPECRVVNPVEGGYGTMEYVGLGMTQTAHDATVARLCNSCVF